MQNYFKVSNRIIFFDDSYVAQIERAYEKALLLADGMFQRVSIYRIPFHAGAWDNVPAAGHRTRVEISQDLMAADHPADVARYTTELEHLTNAYFAAGRSKIPTNLFGVQP